jgi:hypothetical protein
MPFSSSYMPVCAPLPYAIHTPMSSNARLQLQLFDLAQDASRYLRRHLSPAVRIAAALLLAASLAACNASATDTSMVETRTVAPLTQEVATGLPRGPGTYEVVIGTVFRDQRGVYQFEWLPPGQTSTPGQVAHVSRLRLLRGERLAVEIVNNSDPVLHLPENEDIGLIQETQVGATQTTGTQRHQPYSYWNPFLTGYLIGMSRPAYYDPPRTVVVTQPPGADMTSGPRPRVSEGTSVSETPKPPSQRVTGLQTAVSGRAGGTGAGSAVTSRNLGSGSAQNATSPSSSSRSGGVTAPRSGGFSSGAGASGGSAAS